MASDCEHDLYAGGMVSAITFVASLSALTARKHGLCCHSSLAAKGQVSPSGAQLHRTFESRK